MNKAAILKSVIFKVFFTKPEIFIYATLTYE